MHFSIPHAHILTDAKPLPIDRDTAAGRKLRKRTAPLRPKPSLHAHSDKARSESPQRVTRLVGVADALGTAVRDSTASSRAAHASERAAKSKAKHASQAHVRQRHASVDALRRTDRQAAVARLLSTGGTQRTQQRTTACQPDAVPHALICLRCGGLVLGPIRRDGPPLLCVRQRGNLPTLLSEFSPM